MKALMDLIPGPLFAWLVFPLLAVTVFHVGIWLGVSFVAWDLTFISFLWHRIIFFVLSLLVWGALIAAEVD